MATEKIIPRKYLDNLGNLLSHLIIQRENKRPVALLHRTITDIRLLIKKMITHYYLPLSKAHESQFIGEVIDFLCDMRSEISADGLDEKFCDYCIGKIISSFERADKIKQWTTKSPAQEELLSTLPILDHFDMKLKPFIKLVKAGSSKTPLHN